MPEFDSRVINVSVRLDGASVGRTSFGVPLLVTRLPYFTVTAVSAGDDEITVAGDQTAYFPTGAVLRWAGSAAGGNDGLYTVVSATLDEGSTVIAVDEDVGAATGGQVERVLDGDQPDLRHRVYASSTEVEADRAALGDDVANHLLAGFAQSIRPRQVALGLWSVADAHVAAALAAIAGDFPDFWGFTVLGADASALVASPNTNTAAAWAESNQRLLVAQTAEAGALTGGSSIGKTAKTLGLEYTAVVYHPTASEALAWGILCNRLAVDPDRETTTWLYFSVAGVTVQRYTAAQRTAMEAERIGYFAGGVLGSVGTMAGLGRTAAGRPVDERLTADWAAARLREAFAQTLYDTASRGSKVPYTDAGLALLRGVARNTLQRGVQPGHFEDGTVRAWGPAVAEVPPADLQARHYAFNAGARLAGAVQTVELVVNASVSFVPPAA